MIYFTILTVLLFLILNYHWSRREMYAVSRKCNGPLALPFVGNIRSIAVSPMNLVVGFSKIFKKYKGTVRLWLGPKLFVFPRTPQDIFTILTDSCCMEKSEHLKNAIPYDALFCASVEKWRKRRKVVQTCFSPKFLASFVDIFHKQSRILVADLSRYIQVENFDIEQMFHTCFMNMLCETQLGIYPKDNKFGENLKRLIHISFLGIYNLVSKIDFIFKLLPAAKERDLTYGNIIKCIQNMIDEKRESTSDTIEANSTNSKPFLDKLLQVSKDNPYFTTENIPDIIAEMIFAGTDTGTATTSCALMMISMHPEVDEKIMAELHSIFGNSDRPVTAEDLKKAVYIEWVVKETMRLFPASFLIVRETTGYVKLETMTLPPGISVGVALFDLHRDPTYWKDPLKFIPERFSPEEVAKRPPHCYLPFSTGSRNCIGYLYGLMSVKTVIINLMRAYKFQNSTYNKVEDVVLEWKLLLKPVDYGTVLERREEFQSNDL